MSIPGLGQDEPEEELSRAGVPSEQTITHELRKETEWRFEVAIGRSIEVKVSRHFSASSLLVVTMSETACCFMY